MGGLVLRPTPPGLLSAAAHAGRPPCSFAVAAPPPSGELGLSTQAPLPPPPRVPGRGCTGPAAPAAGPADAGQRQAGIRLRPQRDEPLPILPPPHGLGDMRDPSGSSGPGDVGRTRPGGCSRRRPPQRPGRGSCLPWPRGAGCERLALRLRPPRALGEAAWPRWDCTQTTATQAAESPQREASGFVAKRKGRHGGGDRARGPRDRGSDGVWRQRPLSRPRGRRLSGTPRASWPDS